MTAQLVIDQLVRQTTVLIAQVATSGGLRAPLSTVADRVFQDLTEALAQQGVGRKVAADMFGMALRSYQQKTQRLSASSSQPGRSLWEAVYELLQDRQLVERTALLEHFHRDEPATVLGIANDMVESGLVYRSGRGDAARYRVAGRDDLERVVAARSAETIGPVLWAIIHGQGPLTLEALSASARLPQDQLMAALDGLVAEGKVSRTDSGDAVHYTCARIFLPLGDSAGWEGALVDHFQAVVGSFCAKLRNGHTRAQPDDQLGGSTYSFEVWPGHPLERQVRALLSEQRTRVSQLWDAVMAHNAQGIPDAHTRVTFYFGQGLTDAQPTDNEHEQ